MTTCKQMCETIAEAGFLENRDGSLMSADQIFNYSLSGELWKIHDWYMYAMSIKGRLSEVIKKTATFNRARNCFTADQDISEGDYILLSGTNELAVARNSTGKSGVVVIGR